MQQPHPPDVPISRDDDIFYYRRMRNRIVAALLVVSFVPLMLIGGATYHYAFSALKQRTREYLDQKVLGHKKSIDQFLFERLLDVRLLAETTPLSSLVVPGALARAFEALQEGCGCFVDLGVISEGGRHLAYVGPYDLLDKDYRQAPWFAAVMERGVFISDVFLGFRNVPHFVIAVREQSDRQVYVLRATIDAAYFDAVVSEVIGSGKGDAFVVNREGIFQSAPRHGGRRMGQSEYRAVDRFEGVRLEERPRELYASVWLERVPWLCVVKLDKRDAFSALRHLEAATVGVFVVGGVLIVCTILMTTRYLVSRLEVKRRDILQLDTKLLQASSMASSVPLVAGLVREINERLSAIDVAAGWIHDLAQGETVEKANVDQEIRESAGRIKSEVKRGRKVTDRILTLTRPTVPIIKEVQINEVLDDVLALLDREVKERGIMILREYDDHLPLVRSDPPQLRQAFQNIMAYSIASLEGERAGRIRLSTARRPSGVTATVTDNGPGIPREQLARLFEPRTGPLGVDAQGGVALAVSASILERLGGRLSVLSEPGKGTSFVVELPFHARGAGLERT
jgi:two-component system NtrC family sensor kinase